MFEALTEQPADALLALIKAFQSDNRAHKIDLGVGVFRDAQGRTPVMRAMKAAEKILLETQESKKYLGLEGDPVFLQLLKPIIFGANDFGDRLVAIQTPGGSGALRLGAELIRQTGKNAKIWIGTPTWPNHMPVFRAGSVEIANFRHADLTSQTLQFDDMMSALSGAAAGDVVLLHGCCHNPTGIDLSLEQWRDVAALVAKKGLIPFLDLAYQGLGDGLEEDAAGVRLMLDAVEEALVAYSCDKNFGLYRDRVGGLYVKTRNLAEARAAASNMGALARVNWSMPPDHGAAAARIILERPELEKIWREELVEMGARLNANRRQLAELAPSLGFIARQRGLFSNLSLAKETAGRLRQEFAVYLPDSGRINLAGLADKDAPVLCEALRAVGVIPA